MGKPGKPRMADLNLEGETFHIIVFGQSNRKDSGLELFIVHLNKCVLLYFSTYAIAFR